MQKIFVPVNDTDRGHGASRILYSIRAASLHCDVGFLIFYIPCLRLSPGSSEALVRVFTSCLRCRLALRPGPPSSGKAQMPSPVSVSQVE